MYSAIKSCTRENNSIVESNFSFNLNLCNIMYVFNERVFLYPNQ